MRERPILFSEMMVRALLRGEKTVTRRIVTPQPEAPRAIYDSPGADTVVAAYESELPRADGRARHGFTWRMTRLRGRDAPFEDSTYAMWSCPYGAPGDRLWVREAWCTPPAFGDWRTTDRSAIRYAVTDVVPAGWKRRSARFMPKKYSRITLALVDVRLERLHAIDDADAIREGALSHRAPCDPPAGLPPSVRPSPRERFAGLWDEINGARASWQSNPWVWRIEFCRSEEVTGA